jgi:cephalosporin-C deacetylase
MLLRPPPAPPAHHLFPFDPTYGLTWDDLFRVAAPPLPHDFEAFWAPRHARAAAPVSRPDLREAGRDPLGRRVYELRFPTTDGLTLGAVLLLPAEGDPVQALVVGHGYGSGEEFDTSLPFRQSALLFPWCRGLGRSRCPGIPDTPAAHVLHGIARPATYVHGGCVEDLWVAAGVLLALFPELTERLGFIGTSFSGGLGILALAWDKRFRRAAVSVPSFGHHPLRLRLPTVGSAASVQAYAREHPEVLADTLAYYDAAAAARLVTQPVLCACAVFDPAVAPPGQFAIHHALAGPKDLLPLAAGHFSDFPDAAEEHRILTQSLADFFAEG